MNAKRDEHPYASFIHRVEKPGRYLGGEYNAIVKDHASVDCTFCLAFPDVYDIGMSHMGTKILYSIVNKTDDLLMERCFTPWHDMEAELRERGLPLLSLESQRRLVDFDVVGFSLQYEMTFTNVFTMLDLGGVPMRNDERTLEHPLVIAGGPTATHPEPLAPFLDVILVGDAEERLPRLLREWAALKAEGGRTRIEMIAELVKDGGLYAPDLYDRHIDETSEMLVVGDPLYPNVPPLVERAFLDDISRYRFPDDSPVAVAEAIFDRMSVEIARGCTEGCRFCQAGMIYRPVRERDPEEIVDTLISAIDKGGYDEASITSLSTADYSCISPLIKTLMERLRERKVSLGISSLRAYGLSEDTLDDIASVKATGLTFAPEAGTQRMRDVINKNVDEDDIFETCNRVFRKGWNKVKLYFIVGLPTEEDEDIEGIGRMGRQALEIGRKYQGNKAQVTVSASSHVPKPHTPFQWAAMDSLDEITRKQQMLYDLARAWGFKFRKHEKRVSHLECIIARGDARTGWLMHRAWELGARFDGWDEHLDWGAWTQALDEWEVQFDLDRQLFLATIAVDARLPWDHIHVGLEDGFLIKEYRKALNNRLSPPCGKPFRAKVHHTNLKEALAEEKRLVCYDCGIACDMTMMREERIDFLQRLGAEAPRERNEDELNAREESEIRLKKGMSPHDFKQGVATKVRLRFTKLGPLSLQSHLDLVRTIPRIMRRAEIPSYFSQGFSPKPVMSFGPALGLGARAMAEYVDVSVVGDWDANDLIERLNRFSPDGLYFTGCRVLTQWESPISREIQLLDTLIMLDDVLIDRAFGEALPTTEAVARIEAAVEIAKAAKLEGADPMMIEAKRKRRTHQVNLWHIAKDMRATTTDEFGEIGRRLPDRPALWIRQEHGVNGSLKPQEIGGRVLGITLDARETARIGCWSLPGRHPVDPLHAGKPKEGAIAEASVEQCREWQGERLRESLHAKALVPGVGATLQV